MLNRSQAANRVSSSTDSRRSRDKLDCLNAIQFKDRRVLRAVYGLPWEVFDEGPSPFMGQRMGVLVRMLEALELRGSEKVLDIGTGAGFRAALLGSLSAKVHSVELLPTVAAAATQRLEKLRYKNVEVVEGDGSRGWSTFAPYDAIIVGAASPYVPEQLLHQLVDGGRLVIPIGDANGQLLERLRRRDIAIDSTTIMACMLKPLALRAARVSSVPWLQIPNA